MASSKSTSRYAHGKTFYTVNYLLILDNALTILYSRWSGTLNLPQALGVFCVEHVLADTDNIATLYSEGTYRD